VSNPSPSKTKKCGGELVIVVAMDSLEFFVPTAGLPAPHSAVLLRASDALSLHQPRSIPLLSRIMILKPGTQPRINDNPQVQAYYCGLESRIGYRLLLGGTRHFGFYERDTWWPFPVNKSLRAMEDKLAASLSLPPGSYVLDAGCGAGHVALHLATKHGLRVEGIDIADHHLHKARQNLARSNLPQRQVAVQEMDYHHLEDVPAEIFDGVYTSETFVHPEAVLAGFFRILKLGGRLAMHEYDHDMPADTSQSVTRYALKINEFVGPRGFAAYAGGCWLHRRDCPGLFREHQAHGATFLQYVLAFIPFFFVVILGMER
jgi:SAM-dependent methyltransferase